MSRSRKSKGCHRGCICRIGVESVIAVRVARRAKPAVVEEDRDAAYPVAFDCWACFGDVRDGSCDCPDAPPPRAQPLRAPLLAHALRRAS